MEKNLFHFSVQRETVYNNLRKLTRISFEFRKHTMIIFIFAWKHRYLH